MEVVTIGLDISKHVFHVHAVETQGQLTSRQRLRCGRSFPSFCGFRGLRPGIPIERDHAFRSKAATCSDEGGRSVVAGMRSWVRFSWLRQDWRAAQ